MSLGATVQQKSKVIDVIQDVQGLRSGCPHYGLELLDCAEIAAEYGARSNGNNAFYRDYDNQNMSPSEIQSRMNAVFRKPTCAPGFNAEYVIRNRIDKNMFQVGLVRGPEGKLLPVCNLYNTGRGLARMLMSKDLFDKTRGHIDDDQLPDATFERLIQAKVTGRTLLEIKARGFEVAKLVATDPGQPCFTVRLSEKQSIDLTMRRSGSIDLVGRGFEKQPQQLGDLWTGSPSASARTG